MQGALGLSGGAWSANWQITKSTKCVHLLRRLMDIGAVPNCPSPQVSQSQDTKLLLSQMWWANKTLKTNKRREKRRGGVKRSNQTGTQRTLVSSCNWIVGSALSPHTALHAPYTAYMFCRSVSTLRGPFNKATTKWLAGWLWSVCLQAVLSMHLVNVFSIHTTVKATEGSEFAKALMTLGSKA